MNKKKITKLIEDLRKTLGMNQTELGKKVGVSPMAISRWERGLVPEGRHLIALAKLSPRADWFWMFLGAAGLKQTDFNKVRG